MAASKKTPKDLLSLKNSMIQHISVCKRTQKTIINNLEILQERYNKALHDTEMNPTDQHVYFHLSDFEVKEAHKNIEKLQNDLISGQNKLLFYSDLFFEDDKFEEIYLPQNETFEKEYESCQESISKLMHFLNLHDENTLYINKKERQGSVVGSKLKINNEAKPNTLSHTCSYGEFTSWFKQWISHTQLNNLQAGKTELQLSFLLNNLSSELKLRVETKFDKTKPVLNINNLQDLTNRQTNVYVLANYFNQKYPINIRREKAFSLQCTEYEKPSDFAEALNRAFIASNFCGFNTTDDSSISVGDLKVIKLVSALPKSRTKEKLLEYLHQNECISWERAVEIISEVEMISNSQNKSSKENAISNIENHGDCFDPLEENLEDDELAFLAAMSRKYPQKSWLSPYKRGNYEKFGAKPNKLAPRPYSETAAKSKYLEHLRNQQNKPMNERSCSWYLSESEKHCNKVPYYNCSQHHKRCHNKTCNGKHPESVARIQIENKSNQICAPISVMPKVPMEFHLNENHSIKLSCLCDTGASVSVISKKICDSNELTYDDNMKLELSSANGGNIKCYGSISLPISFASCNNVPITLYVCDVNGIFVGLSDLKKLGIIPDDWLANFCHNISSVEDPENEYLTHELEKMVQNEFKTVFELEQDGKLKVLKGPKAKIHLKSDINIIPYACLKSPGIPLHAKEVVHKDISNYEKMGVFEPVAQNDRSDWCAMARMIYNGTSSDGNQKWRLITDFRKLNSMILRSPHGFKSAENILQHIPASAKYFLKADAKSAYFQCEVEEDSKPYLTFLLDGKRYRYCRLPQGLAISNDQWCALSDMALNNLRQTHKLIDDIICFSNSTDDLLIIARNLFIRCLDNGLTLDYDKLYIGKTVEFAGHIVSENTRVPSTDRMSAIANYPVPMSQTDVRSFVSLVRSASSNYVPTLSKFTSIITPLSSSKATFNWLGSHQEAFESIKKIVSRNLKLHFYDPSLSAVIYTDASKKGLGFIFQQSCPINGENRIIQCGSRTLTASEKNYAIIELEALAGVFAFRKLKFFITGKINGLKWITDHSPLVQIFGKKSLCDIENKRLLKMVEILSIYTYTVEWVSTKDNRMCDILSRYPEFHISQDYVSELNAISEKIVIEHKDLFLEQLIEHAQSDDIYQNLISLFKSGKRPKDDTRNMSSKLYANIWDSISLYMNDILIVDSKKIVVPPSYEKFVLFDCHSAHCGIEKSLSLVRSLYWFPHLKKKVEEVVLKCEQCQFYKQSNHKEPKISTVAQFVFHYVFCDHYFINRQTFLVTVDVYSLYCWVKPVSTDASSVINYFTELFNEFGLPLTLGHNGQSAFTSTEFREFCKYNNIQNRRSSPGFPESNAYAELAVHAVKYLHLKIPDNWKYFMSRLQLYRNTPSKYLGGLSPAQMFFGRRLRDGLPCHPLAFGRVNDTDFLNAKDNQERIKKQREKHYNTRRLTREDFSVGEKVLLQDKKTKRWSAIAEIIEIRESGRSYLLKIPGQQKPLVRNKFFIRKCPESLIKEDTQLIKKHICDDEFDDYEFTFDLNDSPIEFCDEKCALQNCQNPHGYVDWIQCDYCQKWFHFLCLGIDKSTVDFDAVFCCPFCK